MERHSGSFYIRAKRCAKMDELIGSVAKESWEKIRLDTQEMEVADIPGYCPFGGDNPYSHLCQFLQLSDRRIFQETVLAEAHLQAEEIHLPLHHGGRKMDQDRKKSCS